MSRSLALAASATFVFATTAACTVLSGVEDYEIRRVVPAPTTTSPTDPPPAPSTTQGGGTKPVPTPTGPKSGPQLCGAEGTWMACEAPAVLGNCAESCKAKGLTCVDNCCLEDSLGKYPAKMGMAFSMPELLCSVDAVVTNTTGGACTDPFTVASAAGMQARCCCK